MKVIFAWVLNEKAFHLQLRALQRNELLKDRVMFETPQDSQPVLVLPVSGEMESTESRYAHLLQPIRELTKNWEIDLASELNDYLDEVIYLYHRGSYFDSFRPPYNWHETAISFCIKHVVRAPEQAHLQGQSGSLGVFVKSKSSTEKVSVLAVSSAVFLMQTEEDRAVIRR